MKSPVALLLDIQQQDEVFTPAQTTRHCAACGHRLANLNKDELCFACQRKQPKRLPVLSAHEVDEWIDAALEKWRAS